MELRIQVLGTTYSFDIDQNDRVELVLSVREEDDLSVEYKQLGKLVILTPDDKDDIWLLRDGTLYTRIGPKRGE